MDVWIADQSDEQKKGPVSKDTKARELVFSQTIDTDQDPVVIVQRNSDDDQDDGSEEDGGDISTLVIWETFVTLHRPKTKFPNPGVVTVLSTTVDASELPKSGAGDYYLPSFEPLSANILEPLKAIPGLEVDPPYLESNSLERVLPKARPSENILRIPQVVWPPLRVLPALIARLRTSKSSTSAITGSAMASLEIEIVPFVEIRASLEKIDVSLREGQVQALMPTKLPLSCQSRDSIIFLYKLQASKQVSILSSLLISDQARSDTSKIETLSVSLLMKIVVAPTCTSVIEMAWTTNVDLTSSSHRTIGSLSDWGNFHGQITSKIQRMPNTDGTLPSATSTRLKGIIITFTASSEPVFVGEPFHWEVHIHNASPQPIRIAIVPLPRLQRMSTPQSQSYAARHHAPKTSATSIISERRPGLDFQSNSYSFSEALNQLAPAVLDENIKFALSHSRAKAMDSDLLSLTAELRIGPLGPGASHEARITMMAFRKGFLAVDCVRVVDLTGNGVRSEEGEGPTSGEGRARTGNVVDILSKDLPVILVS